MIADTVIYIRVSTKEQDEQRQIDELTSYCQRQQLKVGKTFIDKVSGYSVEYSEREQFQLLNEYIELHPIKNIVVSEISRIGRKLIETLKFIEHCTDKGICIHIKKDGVITLNEDGTKNWMLNIMLPILGSMAQMESEQLAYRVKSGLNTRYKDGRGFNARILGYERDKDGRPIVHKEQAEIVKMIFNKYIELENLYKLNIYLNENYSHAKKKVFTEGGIRSMLKNKIYIGKWYISDYIIDVEPIIDVDVFNKVQDIAKERKRTNLDTVYINPFASKIFCAECGEPLYQNVAPKYRTDKYKHLKSSCSIKPVNRPFIIEQVQRILETYKKIEGYDRQKDEAVKRLELEQATKKKIESIIKPIQRRQEKLLDNLLDDTITKEIYTERNNALIQKKELSVKRLNKVNEEIKGIENFMKNGIHTSNLDSLSELKRAVKKNVEYLKIGQTMGILKVKGGFKYLIKLYRGSELFKYNKGTLNIFPVTTVSEDLQTIKQLVEENPDMTYSDFKDLLTEMDREHLLEEE